MLGFIYIITTFLQRRNVSQYAQIEKFGSFFKQKEIFFSSNPSLVFLEGKQLKNSTFRPYKH